MAAWVFARASAPCVFAQNRRLRERIVPGRGATDEMDTEDQDPRHVSISWGGDLSAVFVIETCERCGGMLKIVTAIEGPEAIAKILEHLG
jgi:hypothetical protein